MTTRDAGRFCARALGVWTAWIARGRRVVLTVAALLTILAVVAIGRELGISTNTVDMISPEVPFRQHANAFNAAFPELNNTIVAVVDAPTPERADEAAEVLAGRMRDAPEVADVYLPGSDFLKRHGFLYLEPDSLAALIDRLAEAEPLLAELARAPTLAGLAEVFALAAERGEDASLAGFDRLLDEMAVSARAMAEGRPRNLSWQALLRPDGDDDAAQGFAGTRRFVVLQPVLDFARLKPAAAAIAEVRTTARRLERETRGAVRVRLTGEAVIEHEEMETVEAGGSLAALLSLLAVSAILLTGLRAPRLVAASLVTLLAGLVWTAGLAAVVVGELNLISVAFAVLFLGLGIDFCIHYALRYREEGGCEVTPAIVTAGKGVGCALLLSALCAAVGFFAFLPTAYLGLAELGLIAGLGMFVAAAASLTVLPALIALWRPRRGYSEAGTTVQREQTWLIRHRRAVLGGATMLGLAAAAVAPMVDFDFNPMNLRDPDSGSIQAFNDLAADPRTTPYVVNVLAPDLETAATLAGRFRADPAFGGARTLASFVPDRQDEKLAILGDAAFFLAPLLMETGGEAASDAGERAAGYDRLLAALPSLASAEGEVGRAAGDLQANLAVFEGTPDLAALEERWTVYLPRTLDFLRQALEVGPVARADLPPELVSRWIASDGHARVEARPADALTDNGDIRAFAETSLAISDRATGAPVVIHEASAAVVRAFVEATAYAGLGIVLLLALTLRCLRDVVMTLAPLVLATVLTLATAAIFGIPLNFANVIVLPLLMGLGVSSGIHLVLRARQSATTEAALVSSTPRAVLLSVLTTLASFGTLIVSDHKGMSSMGALLTIAVAFTLLSVLVVLPCLLAAFDGRRARTADPDTKN